MPPACGRENKGGECATLNLSNSLIIYSSFLFLMLLVAGTWGSKAVAGRMGVENPYIKIGVLLPFSPETLCSDVHSGFILSVCCAQCQGLSREGLQFRFNPHIGAYLSQQLRWEIPDFIVSQEAESSTIAGQGVFHCETASTYALLWQSFGPPSKPQADSIPECRLMKVKAMLSYRQDRQPVGCTFFSSQVDHSFHVIRKLFKQEPGFLCHSVSLLLPDCWPCLSLLLHCFWIPFILSTDSATEDKVIVSFVNHSTWVSPFFRKDRYIIIIIIIIIII